MAPEAFILHRKKCLPLAAYVSDPAHSGFVQFAVGFVGTYSGIGRELTVILVIMRKWGIRILRTLAVFVMVLVVYEIVHWIFLPDMTGWGILAWAEEPASDGPSLQAPPKDRGQFGQFLSYDGIASSPALDASILLALGLFVVMLWLVTRPVRETRRSVLQTFSYRAPNQKRQKVFMGVMGVTLIAFVSLVAAALDGGGAKSREISDETWQEIEDQLRVGDVIAYRMEKWSARKEIFLKGHFNAVGYRLFKYGHLAVVVEDPQHPGRKVLFTSQSLKGVNVEEGLDTLKDHNWDAYRLDRWDRVDRSRFNAYVNHCRAVAGHTTGYDFTGMFALWNKNLKPTNPDDIGSEYICSTAVVTILYYAGFESDAIQRGGWFDLVTPNQVVIARGRFIPLPPEGVGLPTSQ